MSLRARLHRPPPPLVVRYEARFHRTQGAHREDAAWTWQVRKIVPAIPSVTNFDPGFALDYPAARLAAAAFIEHQEEIDAVPWEQL